MTTAAASRDPAAVAAGKYLTFDLAAEQFGFTILRVREILALAPVTPLPGTPAFVRGVVNLRGRIVPVVDLRRLLGMPPAEATAESCIVVVDADPDAEQPPRVGCIVDRVREVVTVATDRVAAAPRGAAAADRCVAGLVELDPGVLIVLDVDRVVHHLDPTAVGAR